MVRPRRPCGAATASAAVSMHTAAAATKRRNRSMSIRRNDAPTTRAGRAMRTASHGRASLIIAVLTHERRNKRPARNHRVAQPPIEPRQLVCEASERRHDGAVQNLIQKAPFEGHEKQPPPDA